MKVGRFEIVVRRTQKKSDDFWTEDDVRFGRHLPRTSYNYARDIREGLDSNVVMAPVSWIMRTFTEAEPVVESKTDQRWRRSEDHPLQLRLEQPNPFYDGDALTKATIISYYLDGNGYWIKVRNRFGGVVELWYAPHWALQPKWPEHRSNTVFISHYEYSPGNGQTIDLLPQDVVHFRFGIDPRNTRKGYSPLKPLLREVFTDEEAANFTAAILRNQGVPGLIVSPKAAGASMTREKAEEAKQRLIQHFTRDRRGEPFVATLPTEIAQFGFDPNQLMLGNLRDIAEERVCAMVGLPAAVVGFGAGLQQTKVGATMRELVRLARVSCINPMARSFGKTLKAQLMPDFVGQPRRFRVRYDMSEVSVFQEDETEFAKRVLLKVNGGVLRVVHAQEMLGDEVDPSQDVYLRDSRFVAVPANKDPVAAQPPPPAGNGGPPGDETAEEKQEDAASRLRGG